MEAEPNFTQIITSLATNGLTALVSYGLQKLKEIGKCKQAIGDALQGDAAWVSTIQQVAGQIVRAELPPGRKLEATMLQLFLESPTTESIVRQIYSDSLQEATSNQSRGQLQKEFQVCLAYHLGVKAEAVNQLGRDLFEAISMGCNTALNCAVSQGILSAHEAKSVARHRMVLDELEAIRRNLDFLRAKPQLDVGAITDFEEKYRYQVRERTRQITIPHFDRAPRIDIDKIFVAPSFTSMPREERREPETLSLDDFLGCLYRSVLLGDPGGGKSTVAQKICYELSANYDKRAVAGRRLTPVLVILREYSGRKKRDGCSIVQFIEGEVTSKYQLARQAPSEAFEYLFHNGHAIVIFDGLDELLDASHRRDISRDVESFCSLFPAVPVLVTSRMVGYEKAPLDSNRFQEFRIGAFDNEQVSEYARNWFGNDPDLAGEKRQQMLKPFSKRVKLSRT
jgi:hypothetical protein